jgi:hypothetical protein
MADLLFDYRIKKTAEIFEEDSIFKKILAKYGLYIPDTHIDQRNPDRIKLYEELSELLLADYDFISSRNIDDLWKLQFRVNRLNQIFDKPDIIDYDLYKQIMFTFKYSTIKHFFQDNFTKFLPSPDAAVINNNEKMKMFQAAFMKEYDRFADIIDSVYDIVDVDKVDNQYLAYLIQLLGYEKGDDGGLLGNDSFRQLAKNIIEVYKMKGTNYSFELFFNFLGFEIDLQEFWFDKRFSDVNISINPFTNSTNPDHFAFYLTPIKPTMYIPLGMSKPYQVMENDLTDIRSHLWFEKKIKDGVSVDVLLKNLQDEEPEEGFDYTFFKTNVITYSVRRIRSKETDADELSAEDEKIINAYADFLTPIFIMKQVAISVSPFEDVAEGLYFTDNSLYDRNLRTIINMWKHHVEKFILDDWVDDPLEPWNASGRAPLRYLEQTDVDTPTTIGSQNRSIDREEKRKYTIWLRNSDDSMATLFDSDEMQKVNGSEVEFASGNLLNVSVSNTALFNFINDKEKLITLWDLIMFDDTSIMAVTLGNTDDSSFEGDDSIAKIVNFVEEMHNRVHRLEELNIFTRDYRDWDDFKEIRRLPSFADSIDQFMGLNTFCSREITQDRTEIMMNDDEAAHTPWLFYDFLNLIIQSNVRDIRYIARGIARLLGISDMYNEYIDTMTGGNFILGNSINLIDIPRIGSGIAYLDGGYLPSIHPFVISRDNPVLLEVLKNSIEDVISNYITSFEGQISLFDEVTFELMINSTSESAMLSMISDEIERIIDMFIDMEGSIYSDGTSETDVDFISSIEPIAINLSGYFEHAYAHLESMTGGIELSGNSENELGYNIEVINERLFTIESAMEVEIDYFEEFTGSIFVLEDYGYDLDDDFNFFLFEYDEPVEPIIFIEGEFECENEYVDEFNGYLFYFDGESEVENEYLEFMEGYLFTFGINDVEVEFTTETLSVDLFMTGEAEVENDYLEFMEGYLFTFGINDVEIEFITGESLEANIYMTGEAEVENEYLDEFDGYLFYFDGEAETTELHDFYNDGLVEVTLDGEAETTELHDFYNDELVEVTLDGENEIDEVDYLDEFNGYLFYFDGEAEVENEYLDEFNGYLFYFDGEAEYLYEELP